jgi:hypothetical protein
MNLAHYNITINPAGATNTATYAQRVREYLEWIYRTKTGKILLNSIRFHGQPVTIQPYLVGDCNASGGGIPNGAGSVSFSPDTFGLHGACNWKTASPNRGMLWDEILSHELVHVLRTMSGKWSKAPLAGGLFRYDDTEEFHAVMVTNIYVSDKTNKIKTGLRGEHKTFAALPVEYSMPFGFFSAGKQVFGLVEQFVKDNHGFSTRVANDVDAQFNPIADYYADRDKCKQLSMNAWDAKLEEVISKIRSLF